MILRTDIVIETEKGPYLLDITDIVQKELQKMGVKEGILNLFLRSTTSSIFINENEPNLLEDIKEIMERTVPPSDYRHDRGSFDGNADAHLKNILTGCSLCIPVEQGRLMLGTWQRIFLAEWDRKKRRRELILTILY